MSRRTLERTHARMLPDGRPAFEITVGWAPTHASYFVLMESNRDSERDAWRRGFAGELPTFADLMVDLEELALERIIHWPVDPVLLEVLIDDKEQNLSTERQDVWEVEKRKGLITQ